MILVRREPVVTFVQLKRKVEYYLNLVEFFLRQFQLFESKTLKSFKDQKTVRIMNLYRLA
jgi:hypothetical protein